MDWLFTRYASPFSFIDGMIRTNRFCEFVSSFFQTVQEEKEEETTWQFFLHKVMDESYAEFKERLKVNSSHKTMSKRTIETTVNESLKILAKLTHPKGGEANG